jgi:hypothetical protein
LVDLAEALVEAGFALDGVDTSVGAAADVAGGAAASVTAAELRIVGEPGAEELAAGLSG